MKVVILGHSGFIGQHLVEYFQRCSPELELVGLSHSEVDLCSREGIEQVAQHFTPEATVIMCAAVKRQLGDELEIFRQNLRMVENVCEIGQQRPVRQFVYFSSAAVYGEDIHNTHISEETAVQARTFYGIAKYTSERLLWKVMSLWPQSALVVLRPPLVYGWGDASKGYGPAGFLDKLLKGEEIVLWGDASELREFLYVKDLVRLVYELVHSDFSGVLNPVSGRSYSFRAVLDLLANLTEKTPKIRQRERTKEKVDNIFSGELLRKIFPNFRFTPLEDGLQEMVEATRRKEVL